MLSLLVLGQIERPLSNARISHSLVSLFFLSHATFQKSNLSPNLSVSIFFFQLQKCTIFASEILVFDLFTGGIDLFLAWTIFFISKYIPLSIFLQFLYVFSVSYSFKLKRMFLLQIQTYILYKINVPKTEGCP